MNSEYPTNDEITDVLQRIADLLEAQGANPFRVRAYRRASEVIERFDKPIAEIANHADKKELEKIPNIGKSIASSIHEFVNTRRLVVLDRLEGQVSPEELFATVPGIGIELSKRIHIKLHIETLEELEQTAHDGRLEQVPGIGKRKVQGLKDSLAGILSRSNRRMARRIRFLEKIHQDDIVFHPHVSIVLDVDDEYRRKANMGGLKTIVPKRFNPEKKSWLHILHTEREGWHFTAMFSNTARAHELGRTNDWVVIYYEQDGHENQRTVVTEHQGILKGRRVVRGHEAECLKYYSHNCVNMRKT